VSIKQVAESLEDKLINIRRKIHENPELGFEEFETAKYICENLDALAIPYKSGIAKTGIVGTLKGKGEGTSIMLRADIDALPLDEDNDVPYKSKTPNKMHACGHDSHIACLLGAAEILNNKRSEFDGTVYLVFQPAEEGPGGAEPMIKEGAIGDPANPIVDAALALHIVNDEEIGQIGVKNGAFTGSADEIYITIKGKGGHGSSPHKALDPVFIASQAYIAVQAFLTRYVDPMEPHVFTVGKILGGDRQNIISETCRMEATLRTLNKDLRDDLKKKIPEVVKGIAQSFGGDAEVEIKTGYPVGYNDKTITDLVRETMAEMYSSEKIIEVPAQLGAEDFYEFGLNGKIPVCMFWLYGANKERGLTAPNHSNYFDFDEKALPIGSALLAGTAFSYLNG
jgi:amidohydrolase